jgi:hypothetical protein
MMVKSRVFNAAVSMITSHKFNRDEAVVETILCSFPDEKEVSEIEVGYPSISLLHLL